MDTRLREGVRLFNAGRYFECHELLEDFYLDTEVEHKPFLEGLIGLAAALRIFTEFGEVKGPVRMIHQSLVRLENYQPGYLGIKVTKLIRAMESWTEKARAAGAGADAGLRREIPKIRLRYFFF